MAEQITSGTGSTRAAAIARRQAIARGGAGGVSRSRNSGSTVPSAVPMSAGLAGLSGKELARARRAMLAQGGKNGSKIVSHEPRPSQLGDMGVVPESRTATASDTVSAAVEAPLAEADLDTLCEIVEQNPAALGADANSVRRLCRDRRRALSSQGKTALPAVQATVRAASAAGRPVALEANGRNVARQRRAELCENGRGDAPTCRPSGRVRPKLDVPVKVEVGTTLSGHVVTGTQVERNPRVTGNESGTCRTITGTEYIGAEQFEIFCNRRPEPSPAKVGISATSRGQWVTGAEVGRSAKVTGDEAGSCQAITGTEYLGSERFGEFCESKGLLVHPEKASIGATERKGITITGTDEARADRVTGAEAGAKRSITGSQYADAGVARLTINGPSKVALTHTLAGRPVSGTEVGRSVKVTGDEAGSCRAISGTEYLSNERFALICHSRPEPAPAKVGMDASRGGQRITGNLVDRSERVTGNEPGSCQRVTGSQYGQTALCDGGTEKVAKMHTLAGRVLTGSRVGRGSKLTGDEHGGCQPVTGTEYYGQEEFAPYCPDVPASTAAKVGISQSGHGLPVSGTLLGRSAKVTGNEPGSGLAISGTPYAGREEVAPACGCCAAEAQSEVASPVTTHRRSRYLAPADQPIPDPRPPSSPEPQRPEDFSIVSPARFAQGARMRVTGNACDSAGRITGPVNMAAGLVTGTPEFRYRDDAIACPMPATGSAEATAPPVTRITGEGREAGPRITGDDWVRGDLVTGTEGRWAQGRNLTLRGGARGMDAGAWANKERERPEVPLAKVTGSSGNAGRGALVTLSGGARG